MGSVTDSYTYDNGDKLESVKEGSATVKSYSCDAQGRTTSVVSSAGTTSMSYDYEDRMTSITLPSGRTDTYTYNGEDTRTGMNSSAGSQTFKREGAGVTAPVLSDGLASYTPGVSRHTSSSSTFYGTDRQGTDSLQTSATGAVSATKVYDGFGMLVSSTGTPQGPFGYNGASGYQEDADTGLMLLGHRYYDSSTGRFITRDPAKDGSNWYDYCANNPLASSDPTGCWDWPEYWSDVAKVFKGEGEGLISPITGVMKFIKGGWRHPIQSLIIDPIEGIINDANAAWNGDAGAAGRLVGVGAAVAIAHEAVDGGPNDGASAPPDGTTSTPPKPGTIIQNGGRGLPRTGPPDGTGLKFANGNLVQVRYYDGNGDAGVDIDWGHDQGAGDPHYHVWDGVKRGRGIPFK